MKRRVTSCTFVRVCRRLGRGSESFWVAHQQVYRNPKCQNPCWPATGVYWNDGVILDNLIFTMITVRRSWKILEAIRRQPGKASRRVYTYPPSKSEERTDRQRHLTKVHRSLGVSMPSLSPASTAWTFHPLSRTFPLQRPPATALLSAPS